VSWTPSQQPYGQPGPRGPAEPRMLFYQKGRWGDWRIANWPLRMAAGAIDVGLAGIVNWLFASVLGAGDGTGLLLFLAVMVANSGFYQGNTGQSLGKRAVGLYLADMDRPGRNEEGQMTAGQPPGPGRATLRVFAHFLDILPWPPFCIGFFRPLWEPLRRTFADSRLKTIVVRKEWDGLLPPSWPIDHNKLTPGELQHVNQQYRDRGRPQSGGMGV
jgi:uncharacterized RDD family membrane protein YckC